MEQGIRATCQDAFDSIVRSGAYAVIPHLLALLNFEYQEPMRHAALLSLDTVFQLGSLRDIMLADACGVPILARLLPQDTRDNKARDRRSRKLLNPKT